MAETPYTRRLRVALIDPSGYTRPYDHELARALARRGHDVSLWTASFVHGDPPPAEGYRVRELFYRRTNRLGGPQALRRVAKAGEHLARSVRICAGGYGQRASTWYTCSGPC